MALNGIQPFATITRLLVNQWLFKSTSCFSKLHILESTFYNFNIGERMFLIRNVNGNGSSLLLSTLALSQGIENGN